MTVIKAAAVQLSPVLYSREGTVDKVVKKILDLGRQGVQFATFPETVVPTILISLSSKRLTRWARNTTNCLIRRRPCRPTPRNDRRSRQASHVSDVHCPPP